MTPEYIASKLSLLPQFEVVSLNHQTGGSREVTLLRGYFASPIGDEEQGANLFLPDLRFLDGLLVAANQREHLRTIEAGGYAWSDIHEHEVVGAKLAFFGDYDARRLNLVLDPDIIWSQVNFKPRKAIQAHIAGTDGESYRRLSPYEEGKPLKRGESVIEAGWDHEHCIFCMNKISDGDTGYNSRHNVWDDEWICKWCYHHAVEPHDPSPLLIPYKDRNFNS